MYFIPMCGIAGFNWENRGVALSMGEALRHRGPDAGGVYTDGLISLSHRRLSILDISERGNQPMEFDDCIIVYNGEIFNYREIREVLSGKGHSFSSNTDTEVILHAFREWGDACVEEFNGMWAFCIYDRRAGRLFLSRDRFGIKPLYYYADGEKFIFASEMKAVRKHPLELSIDPAAVNSFFYQKYIGGSRTIFREIRKLPPAMNLTYNLKNHDLMVHPYFDLDSEVKAAGALPLEHRLETIRSLMHDSVQKRLISDVPVGSFLSGGLDSSYISALIAGNGGSFKTFSIGFQDASFNELEFSRQAAAHLGTDHHTQYCTLDEGLIEKVIGAMDEPFGDSSVLPTYVLSRFTRGHVTVSLSGDGADELFGGYDTYLGSKIADLIPRPLLYLAAACASFLPMPQGKVSMVFKLKRLLRNHTSRRGKRHLDWMATFDEGSRRRLLGDFFLPDDVLFDFPADGGLYPLQLHDIRNYLAEDILKKVDMASMLNSLEARVPFLDFRLVPLVLSLPEKYKLKGFRTKALLKDMAAPLLPESIIHRKKRGFTVPVGEWVRKSTLMGEYLGSERYYDHGFFRHADIVELFTCHVNRKADNARELWLVFVFNYWFFHHGKTGAAHDLICEN